MNPLFNRPKLREGILIDALAQRTIIIGNSGAGKSTLAARIAATTGAPHIGLDEIYWVDQSVLKKRGQAEAVAMARVAAHTPAWVIEGVFGWLVDVVSPRATLLVWLDLPWDACRAGLLERGPVHGADQTEFNGLLTWAHLYWERHSSSSHLAHARIFEAFRGPKLKFEARAAVAAFDVASIGSITATSIA